MHSLPLNDVKRIISGPDPVIFLDNARPESDNCQSYLFLRPKKIMTAETAEEIPCLLDQIDSYSKSHWIAGYSCYEAGYALEGRLRPFLKNHKTDSGPLAWFAVFDEPYIFDHAKGFWNKTLPSIKHRKPDAEPYQLELKASLQPSIVKAEYLKKINRIKTYIARGHTYQVNFTFDMRLRSSADSWRLYTALRLRQPTPFCAYIRTGKRTICSFSPELFFSVRKNHITVKPMKGTAPRGRFGDEDRAMAAALSRDPKNRSENVMIVDLERNDLGKICKTGTITVEKLFQIETHPTLFQMTSTIRGRLKQNCCFSDIVNGLFPCGSVTGAPKIRSMEIIHELERGERGVYCGMIGFTSPQGRAVFSVPIRTLENQGRATNWKYRVGSGIVWDSKPADEWQECLTKCKFLYEAPPAFELFESILAKNGRLVYLKEHLDRLRASAHYWGFPWHEDALLKTIRAINQSLKNTLPGKVRIFLKN
ncbi:MAG: aminodeoxychorismate synthase component I, partial [Chitinivibrionales bacterium]|nr:aminodeoxychorismate synthase component I [Chitinivibrionales bacterium]